MPPCVGGEIYVPLMTTHGYLPLEAKSHLALKYIEVARLELDLW